MGSNGISSFGLNADIRVRLHVRMGLVLMAVQSKPYIYVDFVRRIYVRCNFILFTKVPEYELNRIISPYPTLSRCRNRQDHVPETWLTGCCLHSTLICNRQKSFSYSSSLLKCSRSSTPVKTWPVDRTLKAVFSELFGRK